MERWDFLYISLFLLMELTHETEHLYMHRMMYVRAYILFVVESVHCNVSAYVERLTGLQVLVTFTLISGQQNYKTNY